MREKEREKRREEKKRLKKAKILKDYYQLLLRIWNIWNHTLRGIMENSIITTINCFEISYIVNHRLNL